MTSATSNTAHDTICMHERMIFYMDCSAITSLKSTVYSCFQKVCIQYKCKVLSAVIRSSLEAMLHTITSDKLHQLTTNSTSCPQIALAAHK